MLSQIEKHEIMNRTRGMIDEELSITLKCIPTVYIMEELARREGRIVDTLANMCQLWDDVVMEKPIDQMSLEEKEEFVKRLRRVLYYGNE